MREKGSEGKKERGESMGVERLEKIKEEVREK